MKYTKTLPTAPGWYWRRYTETNYAGEEQTISQIVELRIYCKKIALGNSTLKGFKAMEESEWAGPIAEPGNVYPILIDGLGLIRDCAANAVNTGALLHETAKENLIVIDTTASMLLKLLFTGELV